MMGNPWGGHIKIELKSEEEIVHFANENDYIELDAFTKTIPGSSIYDGLDASFTVKTDISKFLNGDVEQLNINEVDDNNIQSKLIGEHPVFNQSIPVQARGNAFVHPENPTRGFFYNWSLQPIAYRHVVQGNTLLQIYDDWKSHREAQGLDVFPVQITEDFVTPEMFQARWLYIPVKPAGIKIINENTDVTYSKYIALEDYMNYILGLPSEKIFADVNTAFRDVTAKNYFSKIFGQMISEDSDTYAELDKNTA